MFFYINLCYNSSNCKIGGIIINIKERKDGLSFFTFLAIISFLVLIVFIWTGKTVTLKVDGKEEKIRTYALTVGQLLMLENVELKEKDEVTPGWNFFLKNGTTVTVDRHNAVTVETENGKETIRYKEKMEMVSTAYTYTGNDTRTGVPPERGIVAVDPEVIPLGTQLFVENYGYAHALDTGADIKGKRIDLFMKTRNRALTWGRRHVDVYVLKNQEEEKNMTEVQLYR